MAKVIFVLRDKQGGVKDKTETPIYLVYRIGNDKIIYPTGFKVNPDHWQFDNERVNPKKTKCINKDVINNFLNELRTAVDKFTAKERAEKRPISKQILKKFIDDHLRPQEPIENDLNRFFEGFINRAESKTNPSTGKPIAKGTIQIYKRCHKLIKEYESEKRLKLDFDRIDLEFYENFTEMLQAKGLATNTIGKIIKTLKIFLNDATERKLNTNTTYKSRKFKVITEESESIYLNDSDLKKLIDLDLCEKPTYDQTRDLFLIGCYTGLRYSDYSNIKPEQITEHENGLQLLEIKQQKTGDKIVIPCHPTVINILNKYQGKLPKAITNQKFNSYIKEIAKKAKIKDPTHKAITKGGRAVSKQYEKHELVTSHTARRSFATNLYKSGFPSISIMRITGHKTETAFLKYIKVTPEEHAKLLYTHWISKGQHLQVV